MEEPMSRAGSFKSHHIILITPCSHYTDNIMLKGPTVKELLPPGSLYCRRTTRYTKKPSTTLGNYETVRTGKLLNVLKMITDGLDSLYGFTTFIVFFHDFIVFYKNPDF